MHFHAGGIQTDRFNANAYQLLALQLLKHRIQHATLGPAIHTGVDGMPWTKAFGQSAPLAAVLGDIEQGVEKLQVRHPYISALTGKTGGNTLVLLRGDLHAAQHSTESRFSVNTP